MTDHLEWIGFYSKSRDKGFLFRQICKSTIKKLGLMTPRMGFIDFHINGERIGIMNIEEHFSKHLAEN